MNQVLKLKKLANLGFFDKNTLAQFMELSENSLYANIKRWLQSGLILPLKKGLYVTADYVTSQKNSRSYTEFIANKLREPSYLSMDYVLQTYNILSESVYGFTSVTLKSKRIYRNKFGIFIYRNIREELFNGYEIKQVDDFKIRVGTKAKALFDYFYYKLFRIRDINAELIETFRLNYDSLTTAELNEFSRYCKTSKTEKMLKLPGIIRKIS